MKTINRLALVLSLFVAAFAPHGQSAQPCSKLTATGNSEYPPYLWRDANQSGALQGANRIIMDELGRRLGIQIQLQDVGSWARAQEMLKTGRIDLIAGAFFTVPRIQYMDYVYPAFLDTTSVVWSKQGSALPYHNAHDLIGKVGVTVINNSFGQKFDEFAKQKLTIEYVTSLEQAFKMVDHQRADYALYEKNPGLAYANLWGYEHKIQALTPPISSEGLHLTISHRSACNTGALRGQLAKVIREMVDDGFMQQALQQGLKAWQASTR